MVSSILITGRSELVKMASGNPERKQLASKVKQYKRWLLNEKTGYGEYYMSFAMAILQHLSTSGRLVFSIDGSEVGKGCMCLMFSVIYKDRAIPIIWSVHKAKKGHLRELVHRQLLNSLSLLIPTGCRVVITGDGEFDGCDWQSDIRLLGWDYVLRTGSKMIIREQGEEETFYPKDVSPHSHSQTLFFESVYFSRKELLVNLFIWHKKGFQQPIFLVTNLDYGAEIKQFYKKRFKIEPFFRDQKSKGFCIHKSGLQDPMRIAKLLIATCLAYVFGIMAGTKASKSKFYKQFSRGVNGQLSLFQIGYRFILFLVDIRQWRAFSIKGNLPIEIPF